MQVGKQHLALAQHRAFVRLRFLDLYHQLRAREDFIGRVDDLGSNLRILGVADADALAGIGLNHDLVTVLDRLAHARRRHADPIFVILDFLGNAYQHDNKPP